VSGTRPLLARTANKRPQPPYDLLLPVFTPLARVFFRDALQRTIDGQPSSRWRVIHHATSRRAANNHPAHRPSTTMNVTSTRSRASIATSRSFASIRNSHSSRRRRARWTTCSMMYFLKWTHRPFARGGAGDSRCLPCGRHPAPLRSSTRAQYPSDALLFHLYSQSRAAWHDPLTRIRDLPWPRLSSSRPGFPSLVTTLRWRPRCGRPRAQPVQRQCHQWRHFGPEVIDLVRLTAVNRTGTNRCAVAGSRQFGTSCGKAQRKNRRVRDGTYRSWEKPYSAVESLGATSSTGRVERSATSVGNLWQHALAQPRVRAPSVRAHQRDRDSRFVP
jgi:hypothetical protein